MYFVAVVGTMTLTAVDQLAVAEGPMEYGAIYEGFALLLDFRFPSKTNHRSMYSHRK